MSTVHEWSNVSHKIIGAGVLKTNWTMTPDRQLQLLIFIRNPEVQPSRNTNMGDCIAPEVVKSCG